MRFLFPILALISAFPTSVQSEIRSIEPARLVLLGTAGGPIPRTERSQPASAIVVGGQVYLFDAGDGVLRQMSAKNLGVGGVKAVFLTHHHIDHIADLPVLMIDRWVLSNSSRLDVYGPPGTGAMVAGTLKAFAPVENAPVAIGGPRKPPLALSARGRDLPRSLDKPHLIYDDGQVRVLTIAVDHYHYPPASREAKLSRSYAFRVEAGGKVFVFSGDTGPSENLKILAKDADYFVCEVIDLGRIESRLRSGSEFAPDQVPAMMRHMSEDHLTGTQIGEIAAAANVKRVILTHFAPGSDGEGDPASYAQGISDRFKGEVILGRDLDEF